MLMEEKVRWQKKDDPFSSSFFYVLMGQCFWWVAVLHILQNFYNNIIPDLLWNDVIKDDFG